jgi:hypothetical protein
MGRTSGLDGGTSVSAAPASSARPPLVIACLLLAPALAAVALAGCSSPAPVQSVAALATQKVYVSPVTSAGLPVAGYRTTREVGNASCSPGSEAIGQAYRCFAGDAIYDPCWAVKAAKPSVLCMTYPWLRTAVKLIASSALGALPAQPTQPGEPWGVQLTGGQRCLLVQGAHGVFRGRVIDYYCGQHLLLLRGLDRTTATWTARSVVVSGSGTLSPGRTEKIGTAWYGRPDQFS